MTRAMYMAVVFLMATTVGQANQYSGGGGCPSDINSNNVASLLETKPQTGVLNDGGQGNHCSSNGECPSDDSPDHVVVMLQSNLRMHMLKNGDGASTAKAPITDANDVFRISSMHGPSSAHPRNLSIRSTGMNQSSEPTTLALTFITITDKLFEANLGASLLWKERHMLPHDWLVLSNPKNVGISELYAHAQEHARHRLAVFLHPDVMLPDDWYDNFRLKLAQIEAADPNWGVLGTAGVPLDWPTRGEFVASSITSMGGTYKTGIDNLPVQSLDEHLLVLRAGSPKFDPKLPGFDLYGTDIVLSARQGGMKSYLLNINVKHKCQDENGKPFKFSTWRSKIADPAYQKRAGETMGYMQTKWCASNPELLPAYGTVYAVKC